MLPKIRKDFKAIIKQTENAILFLNFNGKEYWIPKSICTLIKEKKDKIVATIAAFKFEEIENIKVEPLTTSFNLIGSEVLPHHVSECKLIESKTFPLLEAQKECVLKCLKSKHNAMLCDTGTGKTLMSLTIAYSRLKQGLIDNVVVFCPASLKTQWMDLSFEYFPDIKINILSIHSASNKTSFERIFKEFKQIQGIKYLIVDESALCQNQSAKRSRNIEKHFNAEYSSILTAFPIERNAGDLFYQFGIMSRDIIGCENYGQFHSKFILLGGSDGEQEVAYKNTKELSERISPYIVRLSKKEVDKTIPDKVYHEVYFDMNENQYKAYNLINGLMSQYKFLPKNKRYQLDVFSKKISSGYIPTNDEINSIFMNLGKLGEAANNVQRINTISFSSQNNRIDSLKNVISGIDGQIIIWCNFIDEIRSIHSILPDSGMIFGEQNMKERDIVIKSFKENRIKYLIISIAINEGFNLQNCNHAVFYSDNYSRKKALNAEDRIHRIGQNKKCHIYRLIARKSIDERIKKVRQRKEKICNIFNDEDCSIEN